MKNLYLNFFLSSSILEKSLMVFFKKKYEILMKQTAFM